MKTQRTSRIMERELLNANVAPNIYEELKEAWKQESELLRESIEKWEKPKGLLYAASHETAELVKCMPVQSKLTKIPFRDETKGDTTSTVASSGCAIIVAKFLERYFDCDKAMKIRKLAEMAVELGYRGYKKQEDGTWKKIGMNHLWFDKFVPRFFGLKSQRIADINEMVVALQKGRVPVLRERKPGVIEELQEGRVPVLLVKNSIYKQDPENTDSHFVCVLGMDQHGYHLYDPELPELTRCEFERIHNAIRLGWIFSK